jgi:hypothetical protein
MALPKITYTRSIPTDGDYLLAVCGACGAKSDSEGIMGCRHFDSLYKTPKNNLAELKAKAREISRKIDQAAVRGDRKGCEALRREKADLLKRIAGAV